MCRISHVICTSLPIWEIDFVTTIPSYYHARSPLRFCNLFLSDSLGELLSYLIPSCPGTPQSWIHSVARSQSPVAELSRLAGFSCPVILTTTWLSGLISARTPRAGDVKACLASFPPNSSLLTRRLECWLLNVAGPFELHLLERRFEKFHWKVFFWRQAGVTLTGRSWVS